MTHLLRSTNNRWATYTERYDQYIRAWNPWITEANNDMAFFIGDQWTANEKGYLRNKRRNAFVFNKIKRVVKIVSGYQRKNRLSFKVDPNHPQDSPDASIWSDVLQYVMRSGNGFDNGYSVMSNAFEQGALKTGLNLVEPWLDFSSDPVNGIMRFTRIPHNRFLLHPSFTKRDLSDCPEILRREWVSRSAAKNMFPDFSSQIDKMKSTVPFAPFGQGQDGRFITSSFNENWPYQDLLVYDEHWVRISKKIVVLFDTNTNRLFRFDGTRKEAQEVKEQFPFLEIIDRRESNVEVTMFIGGEQVYHGPDPLGTKDYRFVPVIGYFDSEYNELFRKLRGIVRDIIDPQREINKRRSKNVDLLDSQLNSGYFAEEKAVVNKESLYQTGQGGVVFLKQQPGRNIAERIAKIPPGDIPAGSLQFQQVMDSDLIEISGANQELLGMADRDDVEVAGVLAKMRTGQALTTLNDLFDNYAFAKEQLGRKTMDIIRANWDAEQIQKITDRQPTPRFFDPDLQLYDLTVTEGVLTDSQKQMNHMQLIGMKRAGINIPDAAIIQSSNLENKEELAKIVEGQAQAGQQAQQIQNEVQTAAIESTKAKALKDTTAAELNSSKADLNKILGVSETASIERDDLEASIEATKTIDEMLNKELVTNR